METAKRFLRSLLDACESLSLLPERFPPYAYARVWRMMPHGNYLIFFRVLAGDVRVGHIRHATRKPFCG